MRLCKFISNDKFIRFENSMTKSNGQFECCLPDVVQILVLLGTPPALLSHIPDSVFVPNIEVKTEDKTSFLGSIVHSPVW